MALFHSFYDWVPLQYSCLENPRDGGAWWAAVYGVAQSRTQLKWLSSSSSTQTLSRSHVSGAGEGAEMDYKGILYYVLRLWILFEPTFLVDLGWHHSDRGSEAATLLHSGRVESQVHLLVPINCKKIQPVHSEGDQPWDFFGRNDAKAETPVLWPPHAKSWLIGKDFDAGRGWGQEEKGTTEDEMAGWHHWLDGSESEWTPGIGDGQGGLACCDSWGYKELDMTERLNWTEP